MSKAHVFVCMFLVAAVSSAATIEIIQLRKQKADQFSISEEAYFSNTDGAQAGTVEAMVKRCASAEILLNAEGQIVPALQPMSDQDKEKRLVESGVCVGTLSTFVKVKFPGRVCLPTHRLTPIQAIRIFLEWAQHNPAKLEASYPVGYLHAFEEAFPCPNK